MATSEYRNKNLRRPVKKGAKKNNKVSQQRRRLIALGVPEEKVAKMTYREVRDMLRRPAEITKD